MMKIFRIIMALLLLAQPAYAAKMSLKSALTGGAVGALDARDGNSVSDGDMAIVMNGTIFYPYVLDADSALTETSPTVISPDSNAGDKRWILQTAYGNQYRNRMLNSEFMIDQRNEGAARTTTGFFVDRYYNSETNVDELAHSTQRTTGIGDSRYSMKSSITTVETAIASDEYYTPLQYEFLGYDVADLAGDTVTVSFWFKAYETGTYSLALLFGDSTESYITDFTYSVSEAVQFVEKVITIDANAITNTTTGTGLILMVATYGGSDYQSSVDDAWVDDATAVRCSSSATNWLDSTDNYVQVGGIQLHIAAPAQQLPAKTRAEYMAECQPYYQKSFTDGVAVAQASASKTDALSYYALLAAVNAYAVQVTFPVRMVGVPSITYYSTSTATAKWYNNSDLGDSGTASTATVGTGGFTVGNPQVATDGVSELLLIHWAADAEI